MTDGVSEKSCPKLDDEKMGQARGVSYFQSHVDHLDGDRVTILDNFADYKIPAQRPEVHDPFFLQSQPFK